MREDGIMRWTTGLTLAVLLAATAGRADEPENESVKEEFQALQGTWQVESWEEGGKKVPAADLKKRSVFIGSTVFIFRRDGNVHQAGSVQIDPGKSPRTVNLLVKEGRGKDGVMLGVYDLKDNTLKIAFDPEGQVRPKEVKPDGEAGVTYITLRRPKPPADEEIEIVGKYRSELTEPNGKVAMMDARIERRGDAYLVTYTRGDKLLFVATALRKGNQLSMCWISSGQAGVSVYKIEKGEKGAKLTGEYTTLAGIGVTGREVLTPWKRLD
jgi:uncharacterized protein (TIGR03067 family)